MHDIAGPGGTTGLARSLLVIRHAVENASPVPISDAEIVAILGGAVADGSHLAAVFGDVPLPALARAGRAAGVGMPAILAAYAAAKRTSLAFNPELEELARGGWD